jgi:hypothetical protein
MTAFGECLPRAENRASLDTKTDEWGIPVLSIDCSWGPNELAMREDMRVQATEMLLAAGCSNVESFDANEPGGLGAEPGLGATRKRRSSSRTTSSTMCRTCS